jgi:hypothetical protein
MCPSRNLKGIGFAHLCTGTAFLAVAADGQKPFLGTGLAFLGLGLAYLAKSRRAD